jgi:hypothetical protein
MPSDTIHVCIVSFAFVEQKVIEAKGGNDFLNNTAGSTIHCGVQSNFDKTSKGLGQRDGNKIGAPQW